MVETPKAIKAGAGVRALPPHAATDGDVRPRRAQAEAASAARVAAMVRELVALRGSDLSRAQHVVVVGGGAVRQRVHGLPGKEGGGGGQNAFVRSRARVLSVRIFEETAAFTKGKCGYYV